MRNKLPYECASSRNLLIKIASVSLFSILITNISFLSASGQAQVLKDINQYPADNDHGRKFLTAGTTKMFFIYNNALWRSNGSTTSTIKIKSFESITNLITLGNTAIFSADDGVNGNELWRSNGTPETTVLVHDIAAGSSGSDPQGIVNAGGTLYFSADDGIHGRELWSSPGYSSQTKMVKDIRPRKLGSDPTGITLINNVIYFAANDGRNGHELWKSDGTATGTVMVKDVRPGAFLGSTPEHLVNAGGTLFFEAQDGIHGREMWASDGTEAGTSLLKDIRPGSNWSDVANLTDVDGTLFFSANDGTHGEELWRSDGTETGTVLVKDLNPGKAGSNEKNWYGDAMGSFTNINGILYFVASKGWPHYIYRSDGTDEGTFTIQEAALVANQPPQPAFTYLNGNVYYFNAITHDELTGLVNYNLWRMPFDGTAPEVVKEFTGRDHNQDRFFQEMISFGNLLYTFERFKPEGYAHAGALDFIRSNGTTAGTKIVKDLGESSAGSTPVEMLRVNDLVYFRVSSAPFPGDDNDGALYSTDGTTEGTYQLAEMGSETYMEPLGEKLFFTGFKDYGWAFFVTEGTPETTVVLDGSVGGGHPRDLTAIHGVMYYHDDEGNVLKTDGTPGGIDTIQTFNMVFAIHRVNDEGFVELQSFGGTRELWKINTTGELSYIQTIWPDASSWDVAKYYPTAVIGDVLYFVANDGIHGHEIWRSDGTAAGTFMMFNLNTLDETGTYLDAEGDIRSFTVYEDKLYFSATDSEGVWSWFYAASDHTYEKIIELPPVIYSVVNNDLIYLFSGTDEVIPGSNEEQPLVQLWISDGTAEGTEFITDIEGRGQVDHTIIDGKVYFNTKYGTHMMRSDGTACGTFAIETGVEFAYPLEGLGSTMIFGGSTPVTGMEPFVYYNIDAVPDPAGCLTTARITNAISEVNEVLTPYPNPFAESFTMQVKGKEGEKAHVAIYSGSGMPIETFENIAVNTEHSNIGGTWQKGFYIVKVILGDQMLTYHVVKK